MGATKDCDAYQLAWNVKSLADEHYHRIDSFLQHHALTIMRGYPLPSTAAAELSNILIEARCLEGFAGSLHEFLETAETTRSASD